MREKEKFLFLRFFFIPIFRFCLFFFLKFRFFFYEFNSTKTTNEKIVSFKKLFEQRERKERKFYINKLNILLILQFIYYILNILAPHSINEKSSFNSSHKQKQKNSLLERT